MNYEELGKNIIRCVGQQENVSSLVHCSTRLRFKIKDLSKINLGELKTIKGVAGIKETNDGIQVIIGNDVDLVFDEIMKNNQFNEPNDSSENNNQPKKRKNIFISVMNVIADCMVPAIPALIAAGLMNAIVTLVETFGLLDTASQTYALLNLFADAPIYFLPFMVAVGASKRFKTNTFLAIATTAILVYPTFTTLGGENITSIAFFGLPVRLVDYSSQLLPIVLLCLFQSYVEKGVSKAMPKAISVFMNPLCTYIIVSVVTLVVLGPIGSYIGDGVTWLVQQLAGHYNWLFGLIWAGFGNFLVATGMHYGLIPVVIANFTANGGVDTFYGSACFAGAFSLAGAVLALAVKSKKTNVKGIAGSTGFTALLGISEPALYGVFFKYKTVMIAQVISGAVAGCLGGILGVNSYGMSPAGLTSVPVLMGPTFINAVIMISVAFVLSFVLSYCLYKDEPEEDTEVLENA